MRTVPISAYDQTSGMYYFARMLDKIRLHSEGALRDDFISNLGRGMDQRCTGLLRVDYQKLCQRVLEGGSDETILQWCFSTGRELDEGDIYIWNEFLRKVGWNDAVSELLDRRKLESGLQDRDEIETMTEYFEYDEGRKC